MKIIILALCAVMAASCTVVLVQEGSQLTIDFDTEWRHLEFGETPSKLGTAARRLLAP